MKRCKCGSTEFHFQEDVSVVRTYSVDRDTGEVEELCASYDCDGGAEYYVCNECQAEYETWDEIPEAQE